MTKGAERPSVFLGMPEMPGLCFAYHAENTGEMLCGHDQRANQKEHAGFCALRKEGTQAPKPGNHYSAKWKITG